MDGRGTDRAKAVLAGSTMKIATAALAVFVLATAAACGSVAPHHAGRSHATKAPTETASQRAVSAAAKRECAIATKVLTQVNGAQTILDFSRGEPLWQAELS